MNEKTKDFIIQQIDKLSEQFPQVSFTYGFDSVSKQHIVEVEPDTEYRSEAYMLAEFDVIDAFIMEFPDQQLLFISNDKYIKIAKPIYIKESVINIKEFIQIGMNILLSLSNELISAPLCFDKNNILIQPIGEVELYKQYLHNQSNNYVSLPETIIKAGESNYAMAA